AICRGRDSSVPARFGLLIEASSKTDREGAGAAVAVPFGGEEATCPVGALRRWLAAAAIGTGRVFRRIDRQWVSRADLIGSGAGGDRGGSRRSCRTGGRL